MPFQVIIPRGPGMHWNGLIWIPGPRNGYFPKALLRDFGRRFPGASLGTNKEREWMGMDRLAIENRLLRKQWGTSKISIFAKSGKEQLIIVHAGTFWNREESYGKPFKDVGKTKDSTVR